MAYAKFFEVNVPAKHKKRQKNLQGSEDIILVGGETNRVKTFLLVGECNQVRTLFLLWESVTK